MSGPLWFGSMVGLVLGIGILGIWVLLITTHQVPELRDHDRAIYFHIAAEAGTGFLVLSGAISTIATTASSWSTGLLGVGLGALLYSTINSPGYYAKQERWSLVGLFAGLTAAAVAALAALLASI